MKELRHRVEEKHRGEWKPLVGEGKKVKHVMITEETAERMNVYAEDEKIRYILAKDKAEKPAEEVEVEAEEVEAPKSKGGRPKKK